MIIKNNRWMILIFLFVLVIISGCKKFEKNISVAQEPFVDKDQMMTKSSESKVSIELTPYNPTEGRMIVDIKMNTHSVQLSQFKLLDLITLEYLNNSIRPELTPEFAGHHGVGEIVFKVDNDLKKFKIIIKDIPDIEERVFEWS